MSKRDYAGDPSATEAHNCIQGCIQGLTDLLEASGPDGVTRLPGGGHASKIFGRAGPPVADDPRAVAALEVVNAIDCSWFRRRPDRAHRVRLLVPDEPILDGIDPPRGGLTAFAVVKQITPGHRMRIAIWGTRMPCPCESCAADLWDAFAPPEVQSLVIEAAAIAMRGSAS